MMLTKPSGNLTIILDCVVILTSCNVAYLYIFFGNGDFILLLSVLILGMRDLLPIPPKPHHCTQGEYIPPIAQ